MHRRRLLALAALPVMPMAAARAQDTAPICSGSDATLCALAARVAGDGSNTHALLVQRGASTLAEACFTGRTLAFWGLRLRPHRNPRARSRSSSAAESSANWSGSYLILLV